MLCGLIDNIRGKKSHNNHPLSNRNTCNNYGCFYTSEYEIWLHVDINDHLLRKFAETMVLSHEKLQGNLTGPLYLFKTQTDRTEGIQG